jgi:hypothetical protein
MDIQPIDVRGVGLWPGNNSVYHLPSISAGQRELDVFLRSLELFEVNYYHKPR